MPRRRTDSEHETPRLKPVRGKNPRRCINAPHMVSTFRYDPHLAWPGRQMAQNLLTGEF